MNKLILAAITLSALASAAHADQVITDKMQSSFAACRIANGIVLAEMKAKGFDGEVLVNAGNAYIAKVAAPGASALLTCEGAHQQVVIVEHAN